MARSVNLTTSGWVDLGTKVLVEQWQFTVQFDWIDNAGVSHTGTQTVTFPNVLAQLGAGYVKDKMQEMIIQRVREVLAVDN